MITLQGLLLAQATSASGLRRNPVLYPHPHPLSLALTVSSGGSPGQQRSQETLSRRSPESQGRLVKERFYPLASSPALAKWSEAQAGGAVAFYCYVQAAERSPVLGVSNPLGRTPHPHPCMRAHAQAHLPLFLQELRSQGQRRTARKARPELILRRWGSRWDLVLASRELWFSLMKSSQLPPGDSGDRHGILGRR